MVHVGQINQLEVVEQLKQNFLLEGGHYGEIPIAKNELPQGSRLGQQVKVFIFIDDEGYLAATTDEPLAQVGQVAWLKVIDITQQGAYLDWGLGDEDALFLPRQEQQSPVELNRYCLVYVCFDESKGIYATTYLNDFLQDDASEFKQGDKVELIVANQTELGFKVIVNHQYWGLLYANEVFQPLYKGQTVEGYVKKIREDQRLDLSLQPLGFAKVEGITGDILDKLQQQRGFLALSDKSSPEAIYDTFGVSKKVFKQAIGTLFKQQKISIEAEGIRLVNAKRS
ncbi:MAG TPA: S1-like domain-containing RNA-binding protein [Agitococcus sp.]|nr:S1-like domain-containing RNA-binding protein [Agitococcus sp.]